MTRFGTGSEPHCGRPIRAVLDSSWSTTGPAAGARTLLYDVGIRSGFERRKNMWIIGHLTLALLLGAPGLPAAQTARPAPDWSLNATIIEACSCPMFCQCYFNTKPAAHAGHGGHSGDAEHFCRANIAYRINEGHYGSVKLDGLKFWLAADLGEDFSQMKTDWVEATFEPATTRAQR